ncbi:hypothetical protein [Leuconostoc falkenbergense]|uniref:hypothetical protein n=1 Tax=Leuconostoc falkenbergense TaxID=2766470 RepID=UPI0021A87557|nr:hypothetical protein [Leuconostoc falkenbergense]MCT4388987.1 hypothetical protein [Leuconostoc falkenbergense]
MSERLDNLISQKEKLEKKIAQQDFKLRQSKYIENSKQRKLRTRILIQKGALLDKYFETENISVDDTEELLKMFSDYINEKKPKKFKKE